MPSSAPRRTGAFALTEDVTVRVTGQARTAAALLREHIFTQTGYTLAESPDGMLMVSHDPAMRGLGQEGYALLVSNNAVMLRAGTQAGLRHGVQSFRQLMTRDGTVRAADVRDSPAFAWRGVTSTLLPPAEMRRAIDQMAAYKLNVMHVFPEGDPDHLRDLVEYGRDHGVMVVPELSPATVDLLDLFPSRWVHIGHAKLTTRFAGLLERHGRLPVRWHDGSDKAAVLGPHGRLTEGDDGLRALATAGWVGGLPTTSAVAPAWT